MSEEAADQKRSFSGFKRLEDAYQQIENRWGEDPQVIDLIYEDLHRSFIQMTKAEGDYTTALILIQKITLKNQKASKHASKRQAKQS